MIENEVTRPLVAAFARKVALRPFVHALASAATSRFVAAFAKKVDVPFVAAFAKKVDVAFVAAFAKKVAARPLGHALVGAATV